jgi:hypothetical protein
MIHCILVYGAGGARFSSGLEVLAEKLEELPDVTAAEPYPYTAGKIIVANISKWPKTDKIVLIGHSLGANTAAWVSREMPSRWVDLIVSFDAGGWFTPSKRVRDNVGRVINFVGSTFLNPLGHGKIRAGMDFRGVIDPTVFTQTTHVGIDEEERLHNITIEAVRALAK